ncbi:MAG TPA: hypothetical protein VFZ38_18725, partial [Vicinamibacterales bacterium]
RLSKKKTEVTGAPSFAESYTYDELGNLDTITYPPCASCIPAAPVRTINYAYDQGQVIEIPGITSTSEPIRYHPNGMLHTMRRLNAEGTEGPLYTQSVGPNGMPRPSEITVSNECSDLRITAAPESYKKISAGQPANLSVTAAGATSFEWYVDGSEAPIAGQTGSTLTAIVTATTSFWVRAKNATCSVDSGISIVEVEACPTPDATITALSSVRLGEEATASVAAAGTYQWSISNGVLTSSTTSQSVTFESCSTGSVTLNVVVTPSCGGTAGTDSANVSITVPTVTVTGESDILQGQSAQLWVSVSAAGIWSLHWSDGSEQQVNGSATRTVTPSVTTTYSITTVNGCSRSSSSVTVSVRPPAPLSVSATVLATNQVQVLWAFPAGSRDHFEVDRCESACGLAGSWSTVGTTTATSFVDTAVAARSYLYRVRAVKASTSSLPSGADLTTTILFSNDPLQAGITEVQAVHLTELRTAVNAARTLASLAPATFTDSAPEGVAITAQHIDELRNALFAARTALSLPAVSWSDPTLTAGDDIRAADIAEVRGGVK